uniref:Hikeshi-like domain-containing protein n=1 Tax=Vannella robusta TaxID=1487602 RepID=A0A7S4ISZ6_9EUKA|mmetsp:Transcript_7971/g.9887  ORF Transcript_7971/g.9887 Transcript_7971/m.9887 type:complete len:172 (+) Transcript_7971:26-541(+)
MFACIVDGLMVNTSFTQVDTYKYTIDLPVPARDNGSAVKVCVFLTGQTPLPDGAAAAIHCAWSPEFAFVPSSFLTNAKPSTIFSLVPPIGGNLALRLGISVEQDSQVVTQQMYKVAIEGHEIAKKVAQHFHNYVGSFPQAQSQGVPLAILDKWFANFEQKLRSNPQFLERQ